MNRRDAVKSMLGAVALPAVGLARPRAKTIGFVYTVRAPDWLWTTYSVPGGPTYRIPLAEGRCRFELGDEGLAWEAGGHHGFSYPMGPEEVR